MDRDDFRWNTGGKSFTMQELTDDKVRMIHEWLNERFILISRELVSRGLNRKRYTQDELQEIANKLDWKGPNHATK